MVASPRARALMVLGTASHVGKSLVTAALCRLFSDDGLRVAPFKAQNMSLNSAATPSGGEIGRAQALQAECARVVPGVDMNPILLKPSSDMGSQVVVLGEIAGESDARSYHTERVQALFPVVCAAYERLASAFDVIVLEGAGSPAEINLRAGDIVNMRMADAADAACVLVADIDRGGMFAALFGTLELLEPSERARIRGFIVNKFRGDISLLQPGIEMIEARIGIPCLGIIPYLAGIGLEEEDGVSLDAWRKPMLRQAQHDTVPDVPRTPPTVTSAPPIASAPPVASAPNVASAPTVASAPAVVVGSPRVMLSLSKHGPEAMDALRVAVVAFPHLSNFTDVDALASEPSVEVWFVREPAELAGADVVILPGTKRTIDDLDWMQATGIADALVPHLAQGLVFGICGGMQILGRTIDDPHGVEGGGTRAGLGALAITTTLAARKTTRAVRGRFVAECLFGQVPVAREIDGYEIHVGTTSYEPGIPAAFEHDAGTDGASARSGCIVGTYLHGVLDDDDFRHAFIAAARAACGRAPASRWSWWRRERAARIDRWAAHVRDHCNMAALRDLVRA